MLGMTVGVATVLAMMAVGTGAQRSIEQQVRAAGLNQITVTRRQLAAEGRRTAARPSRQGDARDTLTCRLPGLSRPGGSG